jgi:hypothetical protein
MSKFSRGETNLVSLALEVHRRLLTLPRDRAFRRQGNSTQFQSPTLPRPINKVTLL